LVALAVEAAAVAPLAGLSLRVAASAAAPVLPLLVELVEQGILLTRIGDL